MALKDLFWKGDDTPAEDAGGITSESRSVRQAPRSPSLDALVTGPSASVFTRTTGLPSIGVRPQSHASDADTDKAIIDFLNQDSKEPGFKEFETQLSAMSKIVTDRGQAVKLAIAATVAANPKLTSDQIARAIAERLNLLSGYQSSYETDSHKRQEAETADKTAGVAHIRNQVTDLENEIARLMGEKTQLEHQASTLEGELTTIASKYDAGKVSFNATVENRRSEYQRLLSFVAPRPQEGK